MALTRSFFSLWPKFDSARTKLAFPPTAVIGLPLALEVPYLD